ncbi:DJ-1/PfpI family protein [Kutzneria buriramensis]|uniref:Putative intracellular protease/amidase n=1 Tax=Kutzneria buriramensis TaxID=1045776 RepID=A0A3E0HLF3_9PSEU|nr:DJ-1/PfpI family protein [Kutzneria buriramensis]REH47247.1 putative intracellular protease/amidase [Kutzneria buriramensis]
MVSLVHVAVYEGLSDWEIGHTVANLRGGIGQHSPGSFDVRTVGLTAEPIVTMGGLRIVPDMVLADLEPADSAMLVLTGSTGWNPGDAPTEAFAAKAREFLDAGVPVAAICGAVAGLAREGLLDDRGHTSAVPEFLAATGYAGGALYREGDAVTDGDLITAGPTEPVAFAREIFARLGVYKPDMLDAWFRLHAHSDVAAYAELMSA